MIARGCEFSNLLGFVARSCVGVCWGSVAWFWCDGLLRGAGTRWLLSVALLMSALMLASTWWRGVHSIVVVCSAGIVSVAAYWSLVMVGGRSGAPHPFWVVIVLILSVLSVCGGWVDEARRRPMAAWPLFLWSSVSVFAVVLFCCFVDCVGWLVECAVFSVVVLVIGVLRLWATLGSGGGGS